MSAERSNTPLRLAAAGLAAATVLVAAAVASGTAAPFASKPGPQVIVVFQSDGCPPRNTVEVCEGIRRAARRTGVRARVVAPTPQENLRDFLALTAQQKYDAVVLAGIGFDPAVLAVARRYPGIPFVVLDASRIEGTNPPPNVHGLVLQAREAAFLAGWLAAKLEQRRPGPDAVGVVGGWKLGPVTDFVDGFVAGAKRAAPHVKVLVDYADDFVDQAKCAALARRQIARGAGTVFNVAGACGLGAMWAAAQAGFWAVGVDSDQSVLGPHFLTSVLKSYEAGFVDVFEKVKSGKLRTGRDAVLTMRDGAAGLGRISPRVPRALVTQLRRLERRVITGKLRVPPPTGG
jgi:basic membrane protein A